MRNYWGLVNLMHYLLRCEKMFGKYIMKKTQQKRRGGKTQKRRGGKTQKRRGEMKRKVMRGGSLTEEQIKSLGGTIVKEPRDISIIPCDMRAEIYIDEKPFYICHRLYNLETEGQKPYLANFAVKFDVENIVYFENLENCVNTINVYYNMNTVSPKTLKFFYIA